ncbi:hypothetical protein ASC94_07350 [Massilia sp. Root418]|jgi:hypothetical protein|uniref:hypothetical protein n=1 Tax=Massilia sp. Root418 TaxID=1736532 RepID=UPI0006F41F71|nr:hypothetical protein [Massilia sp. Root418]KQW96645.1 hypothetical protein ASC94_07350 [Massilia sp. Root418]
MHPAPPNPLRQLDRLEMLAIGYLCLPLPVFLFGWLWLPYALAASLPLALTAWPCWRDRRRGHSGLTRPERAAVVALAVIWTILGGLAGGLHLNAGWLPRMALLRDLALLPWPLAYAGEHGTLLLRAPLGYYLLPALAGKVSVLDGARLALWFWTAGGAALFLALLVGAGGTRRPNGWILPMAVAVLFSGMDLAGWLLRQPGLPAFAQHLESWAGAYRYASPTAQLFWMPNHALPGWLAATLVWRHRAHGLAAPAAALILLGAVCWSPLVALGAAPLLAWSVARRLPWPALDLELSGAACWAILPALLILVRFLTAGELGAFALLPEADHAAAWLHYALFAALEWGLLALVLLALGQGSALLALAALELALLPLFRFGPGNELATQAAIPALTVLMLATVAALDRPGPHRPARKAMLGALLALLLAGAATPLFELARAFQPGPRYRDDARNFIEINGTPWPYVIRLNQPDLEHALRPLPTVPAAPTDRAAAPPP